MQSMLKPLFEKSDQYDRVTSYYSPYSLAVMLRELANIWKRGGTARLIIGFHERMDITPSLKNDVDVRDEIKRAVKRSMLGDVDNLLEILSKGPKAIQDILRELLDQRALHVKLVTPRHNLEYYRLHGEWPSHEPATFHSKFMIFHHGDEEGSSPIEYISRLFRRWRKQQYYQPSSHRQSRGERFSVVTCSMNESVRAYTRNIEDAVLHRSWKQGEMKVAEYFLDRFEHLWLDHCENVVTMPFTEEFSQVLQKVKERSSIDYFKWEDFAVIIRDSVVYHGITFPRVGLLPHQLGVYSQALSRWPVRALLADEVGLGKTIEAGSIIDYLLEHGGVSKVLVLTPASLRKQWQSELRCLFGLGFWVYDPSTGVLRKDSIERHVGTDPLGNSGEINKIILSWHWARIGADNDQLRIKEADMPDLLVVDEAHHARLHESASGQSQTQLFTLLKRMQEHIPHVLLLSATPFQTDILDYYSLLDILGVPKGFKDELRRYSQWARGTIVDRRANKVEQLRSLHKYTLAYGLQSHEHLFNELDIDRMADTLTYETLLDELGGLSRELVISGHPATFMSIRNYRTSLKEIGYEFPKSEIQSPSIPITEEQQDTFQSIELHIREFLGLPEKVRNPGGHLGLVRSLYRQRMVSSIRAAYDTLTARKRKLRAFMKRSEPSLLQPDATDEFDSVNNDEADSLPSMSYDFEDDMILAAMLQKAETELHNIDRLLSMLRSRFFAEEAISDPKMSVLKKTVEEHLSQGRKILVFSRFTSTTSAVVQVLEGLVESVGMGRFDGDHCGYYRRDAQKLDFVDCSREEIVRHLKDGRIRVLVCSDAASEGLNLHSASVAINVDVPWNPSRVLQRFGRVDRLGQKAKYVHLANMYYPDSIEERMYSVLEDRRTDFRAVLGEVPEIMSKRQKKVIRALGAGRDPLINLTLAEIENERKAYQNNHMLVGRSSLDSQKLAVHKLYHALLSALRSATSTTGPVLNSGGDLIMTVNGNRISFDPFDESFVGLGHADFSAFETQHKEAGPIGSVHAITSSDSPLFLVLVLNDELIPLPSNCWEKLFDFIFRGIAVDIAGLERFALNNLDGVLSYMKKMESWIWPNHERLASLSSAQVPIPELDDLELGASLGHVMIRNNKEAHD